MNVHECLLTQSGQYVHLTSPDIATFDIADIAHALSQICRFGGHTRRFYSVAQHSTMVSNLVPIQWRLHALLHDAAEAYFGDMVGPLKHRSFNRDYRDYESAMLGKIHQAFGLKNPDAECLESIRIADLTMLATERRDLMIPDRMPWPILTGIIPSRSHIIPLQPIAAESVFLSRFKELSGEL